MIRFVVPGAPVPKGRPRSFVRGGKVGHYTPKKTADYEKVVSLIASSAMSGRAPTLMPVCLEITAILPIPASWPKKRREMATVHISRPDLDNIVKAICDGCNGVVWKDDCQIVRLVAMKKYGDTPGVEVRVL